MGAPTRYPLAWPEGWKRTQSYQRKTATFSRHGKALTVFDGVQLAALAEKGGAQ